VAAAPITTVPEASRVEIGRRGGTLPPRAAKKRMLIIVNPYATTVSDRLKNLVVYALQGRYDVEAVSTEAQNHATELGREARDGGYDVVVAFGGDGTLNEVVNGLAGTDVPVSVLPGGSTNVVCRTLGIPNDVVDATEHLLSLADDWAPRRIDLGMADDRYFVFSCGVGIDATVVKRVDAHPRLKAKAGPYYYSWAALSGFYRHYLRDPIRVRVETAGSEAEGITALAQNSDPFTYFAKRPIRVCEGIEIDDGTLSMGVLKRATQRDAPTLIGRLMGVGGTSAAGHGQIDHFDDVTDATVTSISEDSDGALRSFPVQVDGDYIGERREVKLRAAPSALTVIA
jgi:diacylglycerol kinase family enzyme